MKRVVLMVDSLDDVVDVVEQSTGASLAFDIHPLQSAPGDLDPRIRTACLPAQIEPAVQRALNASVRLGGASECVPLPNCAYEGRALRGCVHLLPPDGEPSTEACGWPLSLRYATGLSIIELERKLFNGTYLSPDFFRSPEFKARFEAALQDLRVPRGTPPGLVNAGQRALGRFQEVTSSAHPGDSLLRMYRAKYIDTWQPHLEGADCMGVAYSTWDTVNQRTAAAFGHAPHDSHFYLTLCYHLPMEMAEQLLQLARMNPDGQSWRQLAQRKEFARALEVSRVARESLLRRMMDELKLQPKQADQRFVHTTAEVLVATADGGVAYYSNGTPTNLAQGGVLSMTESDPSLPMFWWHGPHTPDSPGGEPFDMRGTHNAMPCLGRALTWKKSTLATLAEAGHAIENGYIKLTPIV